MDQDWCPEWILREVLSEYRNIPIHFFMTNKSDWFAKQIEQGAKWSIGIHPNFEPGSSHGRDPQEVFKKLLELFPQASSWRAHSLLTSNRVMQNSVQFPSLRVVSNRYDPFREFPSPVVRQFANYEYLDLPVHFEDDLAIVDDPELIRSKNLMSPSSKNINLTVLSFHPIHIFLNTVSMRDYDESRLLIYSNPEIEFNPSKHNKFGIGNLFKTFLESSPNLIPFTDVESLASTLKL